MAISQQQIDLVLSKADIVEVIGKYIDLQKKGRNYVSVCPFHDDSDPSLNISPDKKIFKCFVCGTGGNLITFVQEFNNVTFFKALSLIAKDLKIHINGLKDFDDKPKFNSKEKLLFDLNKSVAEFFNGFLISSLAIKAREYLKKREISDREIEKFQIGFCPNKAKIYDYLIKLGYSKELIIESQIVYKEGVEQNCVFENRLIFPIKDEESNIIGFSGRTIDNELIPKYKNSSENLVFKKSNLAYNFDQAKKEARIQNEIIILEGFMDVISLESIGIKNTVAIMGTSLSEYHTRLFSKVAKRYKLFLDGDKAGVSAALKIAQFLLEKNIDVTLIENNTMKDPDELVKAGEKNLILQMIQNSIHPANFATKFFSKDLNLKDSIKVNEFVEKVIETLKFENKESIADSVLVNLSEITKIEKNVLQKSLEKVKSGIKKKVNQNIKLEIAKSESIDSFTSEDYINRMMNDYATDDAYQQFNIPESAYETVKKPINIKDNVKTLKSENARHFAEAALVWNLLENDFLIGLLEKKINEIESVGVKKILNFIIEQYKENKYFGHNWEKIANDLKKINEAYCEYVFEIKNRHFSSLQKSLTPKGVEDCFDIIELYKIEDEVKSFQTKIENVKDDELKIHYAEQIEELLKDRNKIYEKRRKQ